MSGPWEQGLLYDGTGLVYQTGTNTVIVLAADANAATQIGTTIAGRLPYTPGG